MTLPKATIGDGDPAVKSFASADVDLAANTADQELVAAPGAGKEIWVYGLFLRANGATVLTLQDEDGTAVTGDIDLIDGGVIDLQLSGNFAMPWFRVPTNKALEADLVGATTTVDGVITYAIVDVS